LPGLGGGGGLGAVEVNPAGEADQLARFAVEVFAGQVLDDPVPVGIGDDHGGPSHPRARRRKRRSREGIELACRRCRHKPQRKLRTLFTLAGRALDKGERELYLD